MSLHRVRIPTPPPAPLSPQAFFLCPLTALPSLTPEQSAWQRALFQWAFAQAQAVVQPSLPERDLLGVWN